MLLSMARSVSAAELRAPAPQRRQAAVRAPYIVLVGLDLSEPGGRAWRIAFELAATRGEDSEVHAVVVGPRALGPDSVVLGPARRAPATPTVSSLESPESEPPPPPSSQARLRVLQHRTAAGDKRLIAMHFRAGRPERAIVELAREISADVIVVAAPEATTLQRIFFGGTVADRLARAAPCPVMLVRPKDSADDEESPPVSERVPRH
jgi:nucleotide-binding universal stress UspA family protein